MPDQWGDVPFSVCEPGRHAGSFVPDVPDDALLLSAACYAANGISSYTEDKMLRMQNMSLPVELFLQKDNLYE